MTEPTPRPLTTEEKEMWAFLGPMMREGRQMFGWLHLPTLTIQHTDDGDIDLMVTTDPLPEAVQDGAQ